MVGKAGMCSKDIGSCLVGENKKQEQDIIQKSKSCFDLLNDPSSLSFLAQTLLPDLTESLHQEQLDIGFRYQLIDMTTFCFSYDQASPSDKN